MQLLSLGSIVVGGTDALGGGPGPSLLAAIPNLNGMSSVQIILGALLLLFLSIPLFSLPTWIASKIVTPESASYRRAIMTNTLQMLAVIGLLIAATFLRGHTSTDSTRAMMMVIGMITLSFALLTLIPSKIFEIGAGKAIGLNMLSSFIMLAVCAAILAGAVGVVGFANVQAPLAAYGEQIQQAQKSANLPEIPGLSSLPILSPPPATPAPPSDYTAEIDSTLNTALHPTDGHPSLAEREDMVRSLQQKIQAQRNLLPPDDAHAVLVYQNQYNRYLLLLDAVKAERKAHPFREETANRQSPPL